MFVLLRNKGKFWSFGYGFFVINNPILLCASLAYYFNWVSARSLAFMLILAFLGGILYGLMRLQSFHGEIPIMSALHPECGENEIFIANLDRHGYSKVGWKSKRKGVRTYSKDGKKISSPDFFPVFVNYDELANEGNFDGQ